MPRASALIVLAAALLVSACGAGSGGPSAGAPSSAASNEPSAAATPSPIDSPAAPAVDLSTIPTACIGLGVDDCRRVVAQLSTILTGGVAVRYVQVGPFGCAAGQGCPASLAERPQGDVTLEAGPGALSYHVTASAGGAELRFDQQDAFGVLLGPTSQPPLTAGAQPFTLGHCGLWSGIDVGGSWWDPVGPVDGDHPDAINAADASLTVIDPDHATLTSKGGLTVELVRRDGDKYLPLCQ